MEALAGWEMNDPDPVFFPPLRLAPNVNWEGVTFRVQLSGQTIERIKRETSVEKYSVPLSLFAC